MCLYLKRVVKRGKIRYAAANALGGAIFQWFSWPAHAVFAGIIPTGLLYCLLIFPSMTLFSRGFLAALKFYLGLIFLTAALAAGNLIYAFTSVFIFS